MDLSSIVWLVGLLILAIESGLTVSLALVLAGLFLLLADDPGGRR